MITSFRILLACLLAPLALAACAPQADRGPVVLAAASLQGAMEDVADDWEALGHARPVLSLAGTPSLARQIEGGAPADIFFSADEEWMDWLDQRGYIRAGTRRNLLSNSLVLIGVPESTLAWLPGQSFSASVGDCRIAIADPQSVPAGRYARKLLTDMGEWDSARGQIIPVENVRAALALVESGEVECGIVYATDYRASDRVAMLGQFADPTPPEIRYPAALLNTSSHPQGSDFLAFLSSDQASAIFRQHGFRNLP